MATTVNPFGAGLEVAPGEIDRQLKLLWEEGGEVATRASMMNLVVYCEDESALEKNTELIANITREHACRAILVAANPNDSTETVRSWISAHCHISRAGAKQVCCEQITFLLGGDTRKLIPNIVFAHLDSDLPLFLWWQPLFHDPVDEQLLSWVDRLIFDSRGWDDFNAQVRILFAAKDKSDRRLTLRDLNWGRSLRFREGMARFFDDPACLAHLGEATGMKIAHAPGFQSTALLLAGWMAAQLDWKLTRNEGDTIHFQTEKGAMVVRIEVAEGASLSLFELSSPNCTWRLYREQGSAYLHASMDREGCSPQQFLLPPPSEKDDELLIEELDRGSQRAVYLRALKAASQMSLP